MIAGVMQGPAPGAVQGTKYERCDLWSWAPTARPMVERDEDEKREKGYIPTKSMPRHEVLEGITTGVRRVLQQNKLAQSLSQVPNINLHES